MVGRSPSPNRRQRGHEPPKQSGRLLDPRCEQHYFETVTAEGRARVGLGHRRLLLLRLHGGHRRTQTRIR
jgi:hypothetical protein